MIAYSGWTNIDQVTGAYESMHADALARLRQGNPIIVYGWTPSKHVATTVPGVDVVWLGVERVLDDSNPRNRPGGEVWDQRPGAAPVRPSLCPAAKALGECRSGWRASDIRVVASDEFLAANPAASRLFELVRLDPLEVSRQIAMQSRGADVDELVARWMEDHRVLVDIWIAQSLITASDRRAVAT